MRYAGYSCIFCLKPWSMVHFSKVTRSVTCEDACGRRWGYFLWGSCLSLNKWCSQCTRYLDIWNPSFFFFWFNHATCNELFRICRTPIFGCKAWDVKVRARRQHHPINDMDRIQHFAGANNGWKTKEEHNFRNSCLVCDQFPVYSCTIKNHLSFTCRNLPIFQKILP